MIGKVKQLLNLSDLAKGCLILVAILPFYLYYVGWSIYVLQLSPQPTFVHVESLPDLINQYLCMIFVSLLLLVWGALIKFRQSDCQRAFMLTSLTFTVIFLSYCGYLIGALSIASGIVLMSAAALGLMLVDFKVVIMQFAMSLLWLFGSSFAAALGYIDYSPVFLGGPTGGEHPELFWVTSVTLFSLPFVILFFSICTVLVKQWREYDEKILNMASVDPLTQLNNRRYIMDSFKRELAICERGSDTEDSLSCIILDLDHFKNVNDNYGHQLGDDVLVATAKALKLSVREYDIVGRYGGEEFLIILPQTDLPTAVVVAERCRANIQELKVPINADESLTVTASSGVAALSHFEEASISDLVKAADKALYQAKDQGRNCVVTTSL
jgi:diguanylate cyclase (GGDEF)-like protein